MRALWFSRGQDPVLGTPETLCLLSALYGIWLPQSQWLLCLFTQGGTCPWAEKGTQDKCTAQSRLASVCLDRD